MPTCFVVMGYGKKPDHEQGRTFDLDKAYQYIIKPAVRAAGYDGVRSDEIQHAGNIHLTMYEQLLHWCGMSGRFRAVVHKLDVVRCVPPLGSARSVLSASNAYHC